jgi:D-sedoheptulose 7-phosphate isomerase
LPWKVDLSSLGGIMRTASDALQLVADRLREGIEVKRAILASDELLKLIHEVAVACIHALESGGKIILFGNGGSAADAQHIAAELVGRYLRNRRALGAIALTTNTSCLTAIGNDYSYEEVFSRQIEAIGNRADLAIGISTSGNSQNVLRALLAAKKKGLTTVGLTGGNGGKLRNEIDYCLCVPSEQTPRIQEAHIALGHILCEIIEEHFSHEHNIS